MRRIGRYLIAGSAFVLVFCIVTLVVVLAARLYITIWLPLALTALAGLLCWKLLPTAEVRSLVVSAIGCGAFLFWMLSEPEVSFHERPELRFVAAALAILCVLIEGTLLLKASGNSVFGWAAALVLMSWLIAFFSSPSGSSGGMLALAIRFGLSPAQANAAVFLVRKTIHLSFYGMLGWCGFRWALSMNAGFRRALAFGLCVALIHACFDEGRQTFFPDRTASVLDVILDTCGATIFVCCSAMRRLPPLVRQANR